MNFKLESSLFIDECVFNRLRLNQDCDLFYCSSYLGEARSKQLFQQLEQQVNWSQNKIKLFGKTYDEPRLVSWYGPQAYSYSNLTLEAQKMPEILQHHLKRLNTMLSLNLNSVLCNFYRSGLDSMGWHADDEPEMKGDIVSLSLGATRPFQIRHRDTKQTFEIDLTPGSILVMPEKMQSIYIHQLPKRKHVLPRMNLTFRNIALYP